MQSLSCRQCGASNNYKTVCNVALVIGDVSSFKKSNTATVSQECQHKVFASKNNTPMGALPLTKFKVQDLSALPLTQFKVQDPSVIPLTSYSYAAIEDCSDLKVLGYYRARKANTESGETESTG